MDSQPNMKSGDKQGFRGDKFFNFLGKKTEGKPVPEFAREHVENLIYECNEKCKIEKGSIKKIQSLGEAKFRVNYTDNGKDKSRDINLSEVCTTEEKEKLLRSLRIGALNIVLGEQAKQYQVVRKIEGQYCHAHNVAQGDCTAAPISLETDNLKELRGLEKQVSDSGLPVRNIRNMSEELGESILRHAVVAQGLYENVNAVPKEEIQKRWVEYYDLKSNIYIIGKIEKKEEGANSESEYVTVKESLEAVTLEEDAKKSIETYARINILNKSRGTDGKISADEVSEVKIDKDKCQVILKDDKGTIEIPRKV